MRCPLSYVQACCLVSKFPQRVTHLRATVQSPPDFDNTSTMTDDSTSRANAGTNAATPQEEVATSQQLATLDLARADLLVVHRALLAVERVRYEKHRGTIANNSAFLQLVIADPWFDWLRPMAQLVLLIDERTSDKKSPLGTVEAEALIDRAGGLLRADSDGDAFQRLFYDAVQASPELAVLARQVAARR